MSIYKTHNERIAVEAMVKAAADMLAQAFLLRHNLAVESGAVNSDEPFTTFIAVEMENFDFDGMVNTAVEEILNED